MKLKLPFFNRERYIEVTAHTYFKPLVEMAPIDLSSKYAYRPDPNVNIPDHQMTFKTCSGYLSGLRNSATVPCPAETIVDTSMGEINPMIPMGNETIRYQGHDDPYFCPPGLKILKINMPWICTTNKKDVKFVLARHMLNTTPMIIPTGVVGTSQLWSLNVFFYVHEETKTFKVDFRHPLVSLWPLSELPLHVNSIYDRDKFSELEQLVMTKAYFTNAMPRMSRFAK